MLDQIGLSQAKQLTNQQADYMIMMIMIIKWYHERKK